MSPATLVHLSSLIDDAKCYEWIRQHRWPDGVCCPHGLHGESGSVARNGHDDRQRPRQRYRCTACRTRFDDLSGTALAGHHPPLRIWVLCLSFMGLNRSNREIAQERDLPVSDVPAMTEQLRHGMVAKGPPKTLEGEAASEEVDVIAGHKGPPAAVKKTGGGIG